MHYGHPPSSPFHYHTLLTDEMYNTLMGYTSISKVAPSTSPLPPPQVTRLIELLEVQMIQETSKHLSKFHHLMLCEGERDDTTLPLDLWRTDVRAHLTTSLWL